MRVPDTHWNLRSIASRALEEDIPGLARSLAVPPLVARLLWLRGIRTESRARRFLSPRLADLSPPEGLPDLDRATERLARALRDGERIAVCGDYDVDGMTGTALLVRFLRLAGGNVTWSIPHREKDGYGLSIPTIERLAEDGVRVAVTVDNGSTAIEPIRRAVELGIDVVITDHHLAGGELPPAYAIVNPHLPGGGEEAQGLCGCGLAFKVAWAVADTLRGRGVDAAELKSFLRDAMGLVALATVCDVVPLVDENRVLVATGLAALRKSPHPGIQALLDVSDLGRLPLTTEDVGFKLGPRLNAAGRLSRPDLVVNLLTETDPARCRALATEIDQANKTRRQVEKGVLQEADAQAQQLVEERDPSALVLWGEGWHVGVVGIVAARMVDKYHRPAAVIGFDGRRGRGSCRTPPAFNVHSALCAAGEHLESYGGHAAAAGLDIRIERAPAFRTAFEDAMVLQQEGAAHRKTLDIDVESRTDDWDLDTVYAVRRLAPFGRSNPEPLVLVRGAHVAGKPKLMGQGSAHLSFALKQAGGAIRVVGFRQAQLFDLASAGQPLDLAVTPVINEWRGTRTPEFRLLDMRPSAQP